jgi:hypothetical protein
LDEVPATPDDAAVELEEWLRPKLLHERNTRRFTPRDSLTGPLNIERPRAVTALATNSDAMQSHYLWQAESTWADHRPSFSFIIDVIEPTVLTRTGPVGA